MQSALVRLQAPPPLVHQQGEYRNASGPRCLRCQRLGVLQQRDYELKTSHILTDSPNITHDALGNRREQVGVRSRPSTLFGRTALLATSTEPRTTLKCRSSLQRLLPTKALQELEATWDGLATRYYFYNRATQETSWYLAERVPARVETLIPSQR